jgi:hypothetical protein
MVYLSLAGNFNPDFFPVFFFNKLLNSHIHQSIHRYSLPAVSSQQQ